MNKVKLLQSILLTNVLIANFGLTIPSKAIVKKQLPQTLPINTNSTYLSLVLSDLFKKISRPKVPAGARDPQLCVIAPQILVDPDLEPNTNNNTPVEILSLKPLFIWKIKQGTVKRIQVFQQGSKDAFWEQEIVPGQTSIMYDGKPLQPGQLYTWHLHAPFPIEQPSFQIMGEQERNQVTNELKQLEAGLKQQGASAETITLAKVNFFVDKKWWPDALREIYVVPKPSPELKKIQQQLPSFEYCQPQAQDTSTANSLKVN